ncbi:hypothetical protein DOY81_003444 [Sarcophaga bullata]|nr:hypothetical protein DOY81_003444 [Sarcophaga bullata]
MYFIRLNLLLMGGLITAEIFEKSNNKTNVTSFLPYTLNAKLNKDITNIKEPMPNNGGDANNYTMKDDIKALNLYEDKKNTHKLLPDNNWKRLTTYHPSQATITNQQDLRYTGHLDYACKNHNSYEYQTQSMSLIPISQSVLLFIHLGILLYISFGIVALFYRLFSLNSATNVSTVNEGCYFY